MVRASIVLRFALACALFLAHGTAAASEIPVSNVSADEGVLFFATTARYVEATPEASAHWAIPIHAWVFEREDDSWWRRGLLGGLRRSLELDEGSEANALFRERAGAFLADSERGKMLRVVLGGQLVTLPASGADGRARGVLDLPANVPEPSPQRPQIRTRDDRVVEAPLYWAPPGGVIVVSDIDDTVKISEVGDHRELLSNTFLRPFRPVPGLAERYAGWAAEGAHFEYLSSSPWQLYHPLESFLRDAGYPSGSLHLKDFRVKDERFLALFDEPESHKTPALDRLLADHGAARFVLVGDSGERDPEIYGDVARRHPERVAAILIREVASAPMGEARRSAAFSGIEGARIVVFRAADEVPARPW